MERLPFIREESHRPLSPLGKGTPLPGGPVAEEFRAVTAGSGAGGGRPSRASVRAFHLSGIRGDDQAATALHRSGISRLCALHADVDAFLPVMLKMCESGAMPQKDTGALSGTVPYPLWGVAEKGGKAMSAVNPLSAEFLYELYATALRQEPLCAVLARHMRKEYLPDRSFQQVQEAIAVHFKTYKTPPSYAVLAQTFHEDYDAIELIDTFREYDEGQSAEVMTDMLESYIKGVRLQSVYAEVGKLYNENKQDKAEKTLREYAEWLAGFTLKSTSFVDVAATFKERFERNRRREEEEERSAAPRVSRFYIPYLDALNAGRNLRGQLTCFLASTGVGKSHIAKWIGVRADIDDGLHVLHFQLEGSEEEALNAYSGGLISRNAYYYERGKISDTEMRHLEKLVASYAGSITVRSYPRFNAQVSTLDIKNGISEYRKLKGYNPDIVIVDSMDLLTDANRRSWGADHERAKRIAVANDLKDLAADEKVWMVVTYQSTIEDREWLNDERNVLTEYNCSEAKGLARPCTHLVSLNQSSAERKENVMRLHVAKSRFFKKGDTIRIATDYDNEVFYDGQRTLNLNRE